MEVVEEIKERQPGRVPSLVGGVALGHPEISGTLPQFF